jgi:hypothetical protein
MAVFGVSFLARRIETAVGVVISPSTTMAVNAPSYVAYRHANGYQHDFEMSCKEKILRLDAFYKSLQFAQVETLHEFQRIQLIEQPFFDGLALGFRQDGFVLSLVFAWCRLDGVSEDILSPRIQSS